MMFFNNVKEVDKFIRTCKGEKIFGANIKYQLLEENKHLACVFGVDKRLLIKTNNQTYRYSNKFIEEQIKEKIEKFVDIEISEGEKNVLLKICYNKKTAKITISQEKQLAQVIHKGSIRIGFDVYKIKLPTYKATKICLNCGKIGHIKNNCGNKAACITCAGVHKYEDCKSAKEKCVNCEEEHRATSKKCLRTRLTR